MSSIFLYLFLLILGGYLSYKGLIWKALSEKIDKLQLLCLFVLLFIMGLRIGMDDRVLDAFAQIGLHAVLYGIATVMGSLLMVHIFMHFFRRRSNDH